VGTLDCERVEERSVEPADPAAQIETVRLERGARVFGQETGDGVLDPSADRVVVDQHELADDFTRVAGDGIHDGSPSMDGDSRCAHTNRVVKIS